MRSINCIKMLSRRFLRIKALKAIYSHFTIQDESLAESRNKMLFGINKSYELYHLLFGLIVEVALYAEEMSELNKNKHLASEQDKNPNLKFVNNRVISAIRSNQYLQDYLKKNDLSWSENRELIKQLYDTICKRKYFIDYMNSDQNDFDSDKQMVLTFYKREIEDNDYFFSIVEDFSIYWVDEIEFMTSKVIDTIVDWTESKQDFLPVYSSNEDAQFVKELFVYGVSNYDKTVEVIKDSSKNWDIDRVTLMDKFLIDLAITEFIDFPSIPVNVTMFEWVEISKYYSTKQSNVFVNGMLDKILTDLKNEGKINKVGRGLK